MYFGIGFAYGSDQDGIGRDTQQQFVAQYSGQSARAEEDLENKKADTELIKARKEAITGENENDEALDRLDQILKEVRDNAVKQETE